MTLIKNQQASKHHLEQSREGRRDEASTMEKKGIIKYKFSMTYHSQSQSSSVCFYQQELLLPQLDFRLFLYVHNQAQLNRGKKSFKKI
jgi:hypothetical protein